MRALGAVYIALFGILLPAVTLAIELNTGMCARHFSTPSQHLGTFCWLVLSPSPISRGWSHYFAARQSG